MVVARSIRLLLLASPREAVCDDCLALVCGVSMPEMRPLTSQLRSEPDITVSVKCASCTRTVPAIAYQPKCVHCSRSIGNSDVLLGTDAFHAQCLARLIADETLKTTRILTRRSLTLIEQSRRRMHEGQGWSPLDLDK